jgi:hypothetical protein
VKVTVVLIFGFGPVSPGLVEMFVTAFAYSGGSNDLRLNLMKGFFTGSRPKDCKFLRPSALISILYSLKSRYSAKFIYSVGTLNV